MKKFGFILSLLLLLALAPHPALLSSSQAARQDKNAGYVPQELLVKFAATTDGPTRYAAHAALGATVIAELGDLGWQQVRLPDNLSVSQATTRYLQTSGVEAAQPNYYYHLLPHEEITGETSAPAPAQPTQTPNDPRFGEMYGMTKIAAPTAWDTTTGSSDIVVAVIDTGARYTHQDLAPNIWTNAGETPNNGVDDDGNGFIDDFYGYDFFFNDPDPLDENGHGTHTGGTVGAKGNNALGVTGVNWNVRVMPIKIYNSAGTGSTSVMLVNAYNYVRLMKNRGVNIRATSNSYGGCDEACGYDQATKDALDALGRVDVLNVFAAGNDNNNNDLNPFYPANYDSPHILAVASSTSTDARSSFSNFGATTVDVAAPGSSILSTTNGSNSSYGNNSGTSMACPHVAGAAALLSAAYPNLSQYSLKASLMNSVDVLPQFNGVVLSGGRLNVARAIQTPTICSYALGATTTSLIPAGGGTASVTVTSPTNCGWEVLNVPAWITVTAGRVGAGNGSVALSIAANGGATTRMATLSIGGQNFTVTQNGVTPPPTLSVNDVSVTEGNSGTVNATFTVSLSAVSTQTVTVNYATADGTATAGSDYNQPRSDTLTFAPGATTQQVSVMVNGDTLFEADETFFLNLTNPVNATLNDAQGQGTILNDDAPPPSIEFSAASYTVNENDELATATITRTGNLSGTSTIKYTSVDDFTVSSPCSTPSLSARQRCDYVPVRGTVTFLPNESSKTVTLPIVNDMLAEGTESVFLSLAEPTGGTLGRDMTNIMVQDNDANAPTGRTYTAQLNSTQEVPSNSSTAAGTGSVTLNELENQITVNLSFAGLGSTQTAAHIHGAAHPGVNAPVLFNLGLGSVNGLTFNVTAAQVAQLKRGLFYFNVHTQTFGGGEIRGQILPNPLESARFFVRQQYLDFLNRVPDQAGSDYWTGQVIACGTDLACLHQRRVDVSSAFFIEQEFQETGAFVYRLYKAAYGEQTNYRPTYAQFVPDRARVIGGADLATGKLNQAQALVTQSAFVARYPASLTAAQFVDAILATVQTGAGVTFNSTERNAFIADVTNGGSGGRALMMRNLADNTAFKNAVYNRAFVLMQYFGYLRRDPDQTGYDFWLNILNQQPNNSRGMVCAFVTADEYQQRFSAVSTRNNQDCGN